MYRIVEGNSFDLADVNKFIGVINRPPDQLRDFFGPRQDVFVTRAPGRLDVMGGIADYSGSLVLEMPIAEAMLAAIQRTEEPTIKIISLHVDSDKSSTFEMNLSELESNGASRSYTEVRDFFSRNRHIHWASYAAGVFFVLKRELGVDFRKGARILVSSQVPVGKGVSSSAALEVAIMQAVCTAYEIAIKPRDLAILCQTVENSVVGAACGVMDQITAHCGVENALVSLLCQPAEIGEAVKVPDGLEFWGVDSGVRHAVASSDYSSVRIGAFMGYRMIADLAGLRSEQIADGLVEIDDNRWHGYLANVAIAEYEDEFASKMPVLINGKEFLKVYGGTSDPVTRIDAAKNYAIRAPTEHAIYESSRVQAFAQLLKELTNEDNLDKLGDLMFCSHKSYAACGLTESRTDRIVDLVREYRRDGLFGARITGGGSGGTVAVLARRGTSDAITQLAKRFGKETGQKPYIFHGSSPGCSTFGHLRLSVAEARP